MGKEMTRAVELVKEGAFEESSLDGPSGTYYFHNRSKLDLKRGVAFVDDEVFQGITDVIGVRMRDDRMCLALLRQDGLVSIVSVKAQQLISDVVDMDRVKIGSDRTVGWDMGELQFRDEEGTHQSLFKKNNCWMLRVPAA